MIPIAKIQEAERLLAENRWSQRRIAKTVGISRAVVSSIAAGTRPDYDAQRLARADDELAPVGPVERCCGCGGRVYMPCRLCKIRALKAADREKARTELLLMATADQRRLRRLCQPPQGWDEPDGPPSRRQAG